MAAPTLKYEGCNFFRQRLILATLSGKSVKITKIRQKDDDPGLRGMFITTMNVVKVDWKGCYLADCVHRIYLDQNSAVRLVR